MEHSPNFQPMNRKKWIGFDEFDAQIREALEEVGTPTREEIDSQMAFEGMQHDAAKRFPYPRPGEIGGVAIRPTMLDGTPILGDVPPQTALPGFDELPDPPEAA